MEKLKNGFLLGLGMLFIGFTLQSCTHFYYGPNSNNVPLLQKKGDGRVLAAIAGAAETTGFELQSAYALQNHFGAMINFYTASGKNETTYDIYSGTTGTTNQKGNGTYGEIGGGYFTLLNNSAHWIFEIYAGAGTGTVKNEYETKNSKVSVSKLFIQPSLGYTNKAGTFQAAISSRFSNVKLHLKETNIVFDNNIYDFDGIQNLKNGSRDIYWEPSLLIRGGLENVKLQLQLTESKAFKKKEFSTQNSVFSLGVFFSFDSQLKK